MIFFFHLWHDLQSFFAVYQTIYHYFDLYKQQVDLTILPKASLTIFTKVILISQTLLTIARLLPLLSVVFFIVFLCENRQQPTWIFRSPSCTVVRTCVCAPFFFFFFYFFTYIIMLLRRWWPSIKRATAISLFWPTASCVFVVRE